MGRVRSLIAALGLLIFSILVCAGGLEILARWAVFRLAASSQDAPGTPLARFSASRGWENAPGASRRLVRDDFDVTIAFNTRGLRGPERLYAKPPGVRRVLILGDSFAAGYYAQEPETVRARLEALLNAQAQGRVGVEVLNAGTPGYSTDQEYLLYLEEGRRYAPDLVLVFLFCNDLHFNTTAEGTGGRPKPYFELLSATEILLRNTPVPETSRRDADADATPHAALPWRGSVALGLLGRRTMQGSPPLHRRLAALGLVPPLGPDPPLDFLPFCDRGRQERWAVDDMWNRTRAILGNLGQAVSADGARLLVTYVPARFEVNDDAWRWIQSRYAQDRIWNRDALIDRLSRNLAPLQVELVDPRAELRAAERSDRPAYLPLDGHWNAHGNEIVAALLAPRLAPMLGLEAKAR